MARWDVIVVGAGPAGLSAAYASAGAGASTLVLERAEHPRYKTCGGGLVGHSLRALPAAFEAPVRDRVERATFTLRGGRGFTRSAGPDGLVSMVNRDEFDDGLRRAAQAAGAEVRQRRVVRSVAGDGDGVTVTLADGEVLAARTVIGADGSAGITARHAGVAYEQVDLGLELELPVSGARRAQWAGRLLIDWGPLPGSYGWVFPKGDSLTVGVIASRGLGEATRAYLREFVTALGLDDIEPRHDSGHLTRCRTDASPLVRGRVLVTGDAAGLLEPLTREGISFALRSGALAGRYAAADDPAGYAEAVRRDLAPAMRAGREVLALYSRRPWLWHRILSTPPAWAWFTRYCRGESELASVLARAPVRAALAALA